MLNVVFFGNHTVGVRALTALMQQVTIVGIVAHPIDEEDGLRYESVYSFAKQNKLRVMRGKGRGKETEDFVLSLKPDLIWVTDYRYLIPQNIISCASLGAVNIHPSLLPKYRGRAPLNWALINGEKEVGLTIHFIDNDIDSGDIIEQVHIPVCDQDYIGDVLDKCYPIYFDLTLKVVDYFIKGKIPRYAQATNFPIYNRRKPEDGEINWESSLIDLYNLIRAVSRPYPGAFSYLGDVKVFIWKAFPVYSKQYDNFNNGYIFETDASRFKVKCRDGYLVVFDFSCNEILDSNDLLKKSFLN